MNPVAFFFLIGVFSPLITYNLYILTLYLRTRFSKDPDYVKYPKYLIIVAKVHRLMMGFNPYYTKLSKPAKRLFISRVIHLMVFKQFVGRQGLQITIEKKIMVIGALVQLTFGLKKYALPKFNFIALYPSSFFSTVLNHQVKGLTYRKGALLFSWYDVVKGYTIHDDNLNLALHEWAHAFIMDHYDHATYWVYARLNKSLDNLDDLYADMQTYRDSQNYLRDYAFTNTHEFFAVCVEHFFETPVKFNQRYPELFKDLCTVLNQNPLNHENDYAFTVK